MKSLFFLFLFLCFACSSPEEDIAVIQTNINSDQIQNNKTCKLSEGQTVEEGWSGNDNGSNFCNKCSDYKHGRDTLPHSEWTERKE